MKSLDKKIKIAYCISSLYKAGGMERVLANKANYLARNGYEITIITTDQKQRGHYFELDPAIQCIDLGINYEDSNGEGLFQKLYSYPSKQRLHYSRLTQALIALKVNITISMFDHEVGFLWKIKDGSYKLLEVHFSRFKRLQYGKKGIWGMVNRYRSNLDLKYVKKYKRFIVLTQEDRGYWGNLDHITVIPNANTFQPEERSALDEKTVIAVGRFDHQKKFEDLIQIWALVVSDFPDWKLKIFGKGEQHSFLQGWIDRLGLNKQISLCEPVKDIQKEYLKSSIIAVTSRYEGWSMALAEGQSCGLPMVSYACKCGPKDIIEAGRNGFLIAEGDKQDFAAKLKLLMGDDTRRLIMGCEAKQMSRRFSKEKVMKQWLNLFKELQQA